METNDTPAPFVQLRAAAAKARDLTERHLAGESGEAAPAVAPRDLATLAMTLRRLIDVERTLERWERERREESNGGRLGAGNLEDGGSFSSRVGALLDRIRADRPAEADDDPEADEP